MDITYLGHSSFRIKTKTATVITDPFDPKMVGLKYLGTEGDIVTISHDHGDHNAANLVTGAKKVVAGPGEYEIQGVSIVGYPSFHDAKNGEDRGKNTVYIYEAERLRLVHLGDLGHALSEDLINEMGDVDVLMIPVGGEFTIGPKEASEIVNKIEPFFVIPMHYQTGGLNPSSFAKPLSVEDFLKESGLPTENSPKFTIKKEDILDDQNTKIIVLEKKQ
ncbi:MAG: Zn-dependent hydrolase of the beta-lactamase fold-like protein [Candidatus Woesebacteria bacterium GW2011_GWA2_40_7]|uniref:Zn-dependent hydrolase of the beta-lactamase fold-like protein n=3 Tax=Candidatus Woeseibacteriota TaxID=1752722 RepID=A0A0G0UUT9_9BACT|nr:MAG: Zn-dependent hydrolase of the beta-lactamase fold-like protein [Candidatus Woesebacteria bacterium GW2011_GWB1_39_10]KKR72559.1 MAG: Zn-dependent hydrolase of the beta-lactamase fold-like protein [Candidatus Woesebacteria bacterium GW2011_GWA2_40_7]KKR92529.1 MAG: Zn-dependent hydrolase of the beta-lactamase fold-like protein [Candidatus Woesebacteria bacterium GW2011_GWA1_41_13b]